MYTCLSGPSHVNAINLEVHEVQKLHEAFSCELKMQKTRGNQYEFYYISHMHIYYVSQHVYCVFKLHYSILLFS